MKREPIRGTVSTNFAAARTLGSVYVDGENLSPKSRKVLDRYNAEVIRRYRVRLGP